MTKKSGEENLKNAMIDSINANPKFFNTYISDIGEIKRQLTDLERDTDSMSDKVNKMYAYMTNDPISGSVGVLKQVQIHSDEINDNYKALSELRRVLELEREKRKSENIPNRVLNSEIKIKELIELNKQSDLIDEIRSKKDEEFKTSIANKQKTLIFVISTIWIVITFAINLYFDNYV